MENRTTDWGGLTVQVIEPSDTSAVQLNFVLSHGYGAPGEDLVPLAPMLFKFAPALADRLRLIFPAAPIDLTERGMPGGRAWWNLDLWRLQLAIESGRYKELTTHTPVGLPEAREKMLRLLKDAETQTGLPATRTVLGGFSQGAMLSTEVALQLPVAPAGLVILSGSLINHDEWEKLLPARSGMPVLQSHGRYDPILPFEAATTLRDELAAAGNPVEFLEFPGAHEIPFEVMKQMAEFVAGRIGVSPR